MKKTRVTITADINDADYIYKIIDVSQKELEEKLHPIVRLLQQINEEEGESNNFEKLLKLRYSDDNEEEESEFYDLIEYFYENYVPFLDNQDVHTITSIAYCNAPKEDWEFL